MLFIRRYLYPHIEVNQLYVVHGSHCRPRVYTHAHLLHTPVTGNIYRFTRYTNETDVSTCDTYIRPDITGVTTRYGRASTEPARPASRFDECNNGFYGKHKNTRYIEVCTYKLLYLYTYSVCIMHVTQLYVIGTHLFRRLRRHFNIQYAYILRCILKQSTVLAH